MKLLKIAIATLLSFTNILAEEEINGSKPFENEETFLRKNVNDSVVVSTDDKEDIISASRPFSKINTGFGPEESGFCVKKNGYDQNDGVIKLAGGDFKTQEKKEECLIKCRQHKGYTGCETIWDQGNRGCYVHTKEIARGNGVPRHSCWIASECPRKQTQYDYYDNCPEEAGFCVKYNGNDQNSGVIKLAGGDFQTQEKKEECLAMCHDYDGYTACETIWDQSNRGCYVHTNNDVARGNGVPRHSCWIASKCPQQNFDVRDNMDILGVIAFWTFLDAAKEWECALKECQEICKSFSSCFGYTVSGLGAHGPNSPPVCSIKKKGKATFNYFIPRAGVVSAKKLI